MESYDLIAAGAGAAGMMAAITAARNGKKVLLLEKLPKPGAKLKATGGGRCNLTNTLDNTAFMERFGRNGRFMTPALEALDSRALVAFFEEIGVKTHAPDGFRVFPQTHDSLTILTALEKELERTGVTLLCNRRVEKLLTEEDRAAGVVADGETFKAPAVVVATGGLGYPTLGAQGEGYALAASAGHKVTDRYPAMTPLKTKEKWVANCRADTIPGAEMRVDLPKAKKLRAKGDLIFTGDGIRGPVVLDFAREITPLLEKHGEVPLLANLTGGKNEEEIRNHLKRELEKNPRQSLLALVQTLLPESVARELCLLAGADPETGFGKQEGPVRDKLVKLLAWTPLTVTGHHGFEKAMITRGGVSLKEIRPETMESKLLPGLYFCGEVMDLDGPCGGYNLQWSFASGFLAGRMETA